MLKSSLPRHLRRGNEITRIRPRLAVCLSSSSAKDDADPPPSTPSSFLDSRAKTSRQAIKRDTAKKMDKVLSSFFKSVPGKDRVATTVEKTKVNDDVPTPPPRTTSTNTLRRTFGLKSNKNQDKSPFTGRVTTTEQNKKADNGNTSFASAPSSATPSRPASANKSQRAFLLDGLRSNRPKDRSPATGGGLSRPGADQDAPTFSTTNMLRSRFLPGSEEPEQGSLLSILRRDNKATLSGASSNNKLSNTAEVGTLRRRTGSSAQDVSALRSALFKTVETSGGFMESTSDSPLSDVIASMRATQRKKEQNQQSVAGMEPKWRNTTGARRGRPEDEAARLSRWESAARLEERVQQRMGKTVNKSGGKVIELPSYDMNLIEVSLLFRVSTKELRKGLKSMGELPNNRLDDEKIILPTEIVEYLALDLGIDFVRIDNTIQSDEEVLLQRRAIVEKAEDEYENFPSRPPVVTIMGHVDHGKTTLMDALRRRAAGNDGSKSGNKKNKKKKNKGGASKQRKGGDVAGTEAGGITQVISAFQVPLPDADVGAVTFLDTPGHAAFKAMRQSGSDAADVIVLVVAADDGVSPQTVEIINFYKSIVTSSGGGISMMVALNKIDKPGVDVNTARAKVEGQLLEHGIVSEGLGSESEYGPPVQLIPVSGLTGEGLDELIGGLVLQSEVMDLRADANARAEGVVLDSRVERGLGVVADCIIRWGSIAKGDIVVSGHQTGKVRILRDVNDKQIKQGLPSQPVRIVGFEGLPRAGDPFICMESEEEAGELVERRKAGQETQAVVNADDKSTNRQAELQSAGKHLMSHEWREKLEAKHGIEGRDDDSPIRIPVILRADADGSLAALRESLVALGEESDHNVVIDPIQVGIGPALPADVEMAKESQAAIVCFNVKNDAAQEASNASVHVLRSEVIYSILDEAKEFFGTYLPSIQKETVHGRAKVGAIFKIGGMDTEVAGLQVLDGTLYRHKVQQSGKKAGARPSALYRIIRNGKILEGTEKGLKPTSLKHFKDDVDEIGRGKECGLSLEGFNGFEEGDEIECLSMSMELQTL